jgi:cellobiose transport system permease protein
VTSLPAIRQTAGPGAARAARRRLTYTSEGRRPGWPTYAILGAVIIVSAYPLYYTFLLGASTAPQIARNPIPSALPGGNFWDNAGRVLASDIHFWRAIVNSIIVSALTAASVVFFATLAGFSFAKLRFRGRRGLLMFVVATMAVPTQLSVVPLFIVMAKLGLQGTLTAVILPGAVTAFGVFWMTQYLEAALPFELIEAARVDGCSMIRTFWHVALPAARPAAAMLSLFTFVATWTNFFWPFVVLSQANPTITVATQLLQASFFKDYSLVMAGVAMATAPLLILFAVAGKQLVSGIMHGAVKG